MEKMDDKKVTQSGDVVTNEVKKKSTFPTIIDLLAIFGAFVIAQIIGFVVGTYTTGVDGSGVFDYTNIDPTFIEQYSAGNFIFVSYLVAMVITVTFTLIFRRIRGDRGTIARFSINGFSPIILLWGIILILSTSVVTEPLLSIMPDTPEVNGRGLLMLLSLVVLAPIFEEFLCRGIVFESLRRRRGIFMSTVISSLFFALLHLHPTMVLNAFIMGIVLCFIYIRTKSLFASIILHAFNNGVAYTMIILGLADKTLRELIHNNMIYVAIYSVSVVIFVLSIVGIYRKITKLERQKEANSLEGGEELDETPTDDIEIKL